MRPLSVLSVAVLFAGTVAAHPQATAHTADRTADLQVGGGVAYAVSSDYGPRITGFKLYATYDFMPHYGIDGTFNQINGSNSLYERTYEIGPRYVMHFGKLNPYARVAYGRGVFNFPSNIANLAYNMGVLGAGADFNLLTHVNIRAEYEYQKWFGFPPDGLTPQIVSVSAAYHF